MRYKIFKKMFKNNKEIAFEQALKEQNFVVIRTWVLLSSYEMTVLETEKDTMLDSYVKF